MLMPMFLSAALVPCIFMAMMRPRAMRMPISLLSTGMVLSCGMRMYASGMLKLMTLATIARMNAWVLCPKRCDAT